VFVFHDFFRSARDAVKNIKPEVEFGTYTGAWYDTYFEVGVNWASKKYNTASYYNWATSNYKNYGYADLLDVYMAGAYATQVTGNGWTVEGLCRQAKNITMGDVPVTGSVYAGQYDNGAQFKQAMDVALKETDALMVFDMVHLCINDWWKYVSFNR
jgi:hypothetical protein